MGTIYFLLIVVGLFSGSYTVLRKINSKSYLYGSLDEALEHRRAAVKKPKEQAVNNRERQYVDWYLENGHKRQDARPLGPVAQPSTMVGVAFLTNDLGQQRRVSNG